MGREGVSARLKTMEVNGCELSVFGTLIGLVSEGDAVADLMERLRPDIVFLGIPPEAVPGLKAVINGSVKEVGASNLEVTYARHLSRYGEVSIPPPSYVRAFLAASAIGIRVLPIDIREAEYTEMYVSKIGMIDIVAHSARSRRLSRKKFKSRTAPDFVLEWDSAVTRGGYKDIERARERHMALSIMNFLDRLRPNRALAVVEYQRWSGVCRHLENIHEVQGN